MTDKQLEVVREPQLEDRIAELERAIAAMLRAEAAAADGPHAVGTVVVVSTEDLALVLAVLFALIALGVAVRLARVA